MMPDTHFYFFSKLHLSLGCKIMKVMLLAICVLQLFGGITCNNDSFTNSSDPNKDMYVIHAMVYQVGIITNKTDDKSPNVTMGNQEAVTFFRTNGSKVDLSGIPAPLLTNVTAQSVIQVAPKAANQEQKPQISWNNLKDLASLPQSSAPLKSEDGALKIVRRSNFNGDDLEFYGDTPQESAYKRSAGGLRLLFKRETPGDGEPSVKVVKGSAVVPSGAGVQSIALPPLLTLNNNLSDIPVPIPNTSVVHYAKINTLIRQP